MCLYIRDKQPRVAKKDIVVLKYLKQTSSGYESPCQGTHVTLGELMIAHPDTPYINYEYRDIYYREISSIGGGVIHGMLSESDDYGNYCAKAIIPKGTEYWIDSFGTEIAARKMLITEEKGTNESIDIHLFNEILESAPENNGIRVGDYQMIDDSFVHPTKNIAKAKVRGIVCGFYKDGRPIICALELFRDACGGDSKCKIEEYTLCWEAMKLFNGREVTDKYKKQIKGEDKEKFYAFERCVNYRKDKNENWYFGSLGETITMLDNAAYLNAAHNITGLGFFIDTGGLYWTCSMHDSCCSCNCTICSGGVFCSWCSKYNTYMIVPFYAFTQAKTKSLCNTLCNLWKSTIQIFIRK